MYSLPITYTDYNDVERTETFYFNINKGELQKLEMSENGGLSTTIEKILETRDQKKIMNYFYQIIEMSYGEKDTDGRGFRKSPEILENFKCTEAYSELLMKLMDSKFAAEFVRGIMPKDMRDIKVELDPNKYPALTKIKEQNTTK